MRLWKRRTDGFEWQKYVRTTILVRRKQRKEQVVAARDAAIGGLKEAGRAGAAASAVGLAASGRGLRAAASASGQALSTGATRAGTWLRWSASALAATTLAAVANVTARLAGPLADLRRGLLAVAAQPGARIAAIVIGIFATVAALAGMIGGDSRLGNGLAAVIAVVALIVVLVSLETRFVMPSAIARLAPLNLNLSLGPLARLDRRLIMAAGVAVVVGVVAGIGWLAGGTFPGFAKLPGLTVAPGEGKIQGRATPVSGDALRIGAKSIRLAGIEAPEREQRCARPGDKRWPCGSAAIDALGRIVRGKSVICEASGGDDAGRALATCTADGKDVAAELVREGHVFATGLLFARYSGLQTEAQAQKVGLWRGEAERPADYRAKLWEAARKKAPDGCPIKGQVSSDGKVYVLPWSPDYDRIKLRTNKGERYFCSEREAVAAGWKASARG